MLNQRFSIDESPDIVVNMTFSTTVLEDGGGGEERNINWQSPLLSFDLSKALIRENQLQEIIEFFKDVRGAATPFKYRDWSDYLTTAKRSVTKYGSVTHGVLYPPADGVRTEFQLVKRYEIPSCVHFRAIPFPDSDTATIYTYDDEIITLVPDSEWVYIDNKFVFNTPPTQQLTCEAEFDVPVVFSGDLYQYRINKSSKEGTTYSIEGLQLDEIRFEPFLNLIDEIGEIDTPFALCGHFNSQVGLQEKTEIITLGSGYDKRTSRYAKPKGNYFMGKIPLRDDELEYLISFFRCTKGKGLSWGFPDISYQVKHVPIRFDDDSLSLRLNKQGRYEIDGLRAIEVFEPLPANVDEELPSDDENTGGDGGDGGDDTTNNYPNGINDAGTANFLYSLNSWGGNNPNDYKILAITEINNRLVMLVSKVSGNGINYYQWALIYENDPEYFSFSVLQTGDWYLNPIRIDFAPYEINGKKAVLIGGVKISNQSRLVLAVFDSESVVTLYDVASNQVNEYTGQFGNTIYYNRSTNYSNFGGSGIDVLGRGNIFKFFNHGGISDPYWLAQIEELVSNEFKYYLYVDYYNSVVTKYIKRDGITSSQTLRDIVAFADSPASSWVVFQQKGYDLPNSPQNVQDIGIAFFKNRPPVFQGQVNYSDFNDLDFNRYAKVYNNDLYIGSNKGLLRWKNNNLHRLSNTFNSLPADEVTAIYASQNRGLVIAFYPLKIMYLKNV